MPEANLNKESNVVNTGKDGIVIINALTDIPGGRTLDVSGLPASMKVIKAGHIIVKTTSTGVHKPLALNDGGTAYASKSEGDEYVGVLKASIPVSDPRAAIMTSGQVNAAASPYAVTSGIKEGLPLIQFMY